MELEIDPSGITLTNTYTNANTVSLIPQILIFQELIKLHLMIQTVLL